MRRALTLLLVAVVLGGCDGLTCWETRDDGVTEYIGDRRCFRLSAPRKMTGIFVRKLENHAFYEGATDAAHLDAKDAVSLNIFEMLRGDVPAHGSRNVYRIELIGRTQLRSLSTLLRGEAGYAGLYDSFVVVDEIIKLEPIGSTRQEYRSEL